jgi:hypothetical protein
LYVLYYWVKMSVSSLPNCTKKHKERFQFYCIRATLMNFAPSPLPPFFSLPPISHNPTPSQHAGLVVD